MKFFGDRSFSIIVLILVFGGIALFFSASLGLLARASSSPWRLVFNQVTLGLIPGFILLFGIRFLPQKRLVQLALPFYVFTIVLTALVFVPHIGLSLNGAHRWINLGFTTFQPGELLKISVILMLAAYLARARESIRSYKHGLIPFGVILGIPSVLLVFEPNTSTLIVIGLSCMVIYFLAGAPLRDFGIMISVSLVLLTILVLTHPYLQKRVDTFIHPSHAPQGSGYHIQQSLIAIGSGKVIGRGFGQSVQKFNYLPEAESDSVFAVYGEEFGFVGTVLLVLLFAAFALRGLMIAAASPTIFGRLTVTGLTLLITFSAFLNIGALIGIFPLTGLPLPFISHGGTALMSALASVGIILNIAAHKAKKR